MRGGSSLVVGLIDRFTIISPSAVQPPAQSVDSNLVSGLLEQRRCPAVPDSVWAAATWLRLYQI
jgi:hypothetical protein